MREFNRIFGAMLKFPISFVFLFLMLWYLGLCSL